MLCYELPGSGVVSLSNFFFFFSWYFLSFGGACSKWKFPACTIYLARDHTKPQERPRRFSDNARPSTCVPQGSFHFPVFSILSWMHLQIRRTDCIDSGFTLATGLPTTEGQICNKGISTESLKYNPPGHLLGGLEF